MPKLFYLKEVPGQCDGVKSGTSDIMIEMSPHNTHTPRWQSS